MRSAGGCWMVSIRRRGRQMGDSMRCIDIIRAVRSSGKASVVRQVRGDKQDR